MTQGTDPFVSSVDEFGDECGYNGAGNHAHQSGHHERVVEQVFADAGGAGAVKGYRCDIGRIVGYKEVSVNRWQHAQKYRAGNAQRVGQRQHGYHNGTLAVDQYRYREECQRHCPWIFAHNSLQTVLHLRQVVAEVCIGQPSNSVNGYYGNHARLSYVAYDCLARIGLGYYDHKCGGRYHHNLDDDVHAYGLAVYRGTDIVAYYLEE